MAHLVDTHFNGYEFFILKQIGASWIIIKPTHTHTPPTPTTKPKPPTTYHPHNALEIVRGIVLRQRASFVEL